MQFAMKTNAIAGAILLAVIAGEMARVYVAATSPPDGRDAWDRLREEHHCQPLRLDMPSEDTTHDRTVWACDRGEFVIRSTY